MTQCYVKGEPGNMKDGIFYTFVGGKLKTTRYAASTEQIVRAQKR